MDDKTILHHIDELVEEGLSPGFAEYMREWKNFVK